MLGLSLANESRQWERALHLQALQDTIALPAVCLGLGLLPAGPDQPTPRRRRPGAEISKQSFALPA